MSDLKAQGFYQLYRKKTIEAGYTPIGRQRFTGIVKTLSLIPESFDYIQSKANEPNTSQDKNALLADVSGCFIMLKDWFKESDDGDNGKILMAECPKCGDAVVYNYGCVKCDAEFIFK